MNVVRTMDATSQCLEEYITATSIIIWATYKGVTGVKSDPVHLKTIGAETASFISTNMTGD